MGYLDKTGLTYLWGKISAALAKKQDAASAVTMEQVNQAIQAAVSAGGGGGGAAEIYSTQEQVIGRWIDNRPLYRMTVEKPEIYIDGSGVDFLASMPDCRICRWYGYIDDGNYWLPLTCNSSTINLDAQFGTEMYLYTCVTGEGQELMLQTGSSVYLSNATAVFTIEYTKNTDLPLS